MPPVPETQDACTEARAVSYIYVVPPAQATSDGLVVGFIKSSNHLNLRLTDGTNYRLMRITAFS